MSEGICEGRIVLKELTVSIYMTGRDGIKKKKVVRSESISDNNNLLLLKYGV